jgi:hypothetical protein
MQSQQHAAEHTPGPWRFQYSPYEDGFAFSHIKAGDGLYPDGFRIDAIIGEADARLIAAAPDLLAELKNIAAICSVAAPEHDLALDRARAAIAKAEGH